MKRILTLLFLGFFAMGINAQFLWELPTTFEDPPPAEDTCWSIFANPPGGTQPSLSLVENPDVGGVNTSDWCAQVDIDAAATRWVGAWSNDYGPFILSADSHHVQVMVYSDVPHIVGVRGQNPIDPGAAPGQYGFIGFDTMTKVNEWELLTFEYPDTMWYGYNTLTIFFDLNDNRTEASTLLWDGLELLPSPVEYVMPVDFEQSSMEDTNWNSFGNQPDAPEDLTLVENPDKAGINTSDHCAKFMVNATADPWVGAWSAAYGTLTFTEELNTMQMMVWKTVEGPVGIRAQGGLDGAPDVLVKVNNTKINEWELITFDFSEAVGNSYGNFVVFTDWFDEGTRTEAHTFYFDNITLTSAPPAGLTLPVTFEHAEEDTNWNQFSNAGDLPENMGIIANPNASGINTSDNVLKYVVLDGADPWAGAYTDAYGTFEITAEDHAMSMMVHKDIISNCALKVEGGTDPTQIEVKVPNTVTGEWEMLTFDFSAGIGNTYTRLVFFPDFPDTRTAGTTVYIDNIDWIDISSVRKVNNAYLSVYPNPARESVTVQYPEMKQITITNIVGQTIRTMEFMPVGLKVVDVSELESGVYFITIDSEAGILSTKFIKK